MLNKLKLISFINLLRISFILTYPTQSIGPEPTATESDGNYSYLKSFYGWHVHIIVGNVIVGSGTLIDVNTVLTTLAILQNYTAEQLLVYGGAVYRHFHQTNPNKIYKIKLISGTDFNSSKFRNKYKSDCALLYTEIDVEVNYNYKNMDWPVLDAKLLKETELMAKNLVLNRDDDDKLDGNDTMPDEIDVSQSNCYYSFSDVLAKGIRCSLAQKQYIVNQCFNEFNLFNLPSNNANANVTLGTFALDFICKHNDSLVRIFRNLYISFRSTFIAVREK